MAAPLIRIPQIQGGTLYAFASGTRDITRAFNNPDLQFDFSNYALVNLPELKEPDQSHNENTLDFEQFLDYSGAQYDIATLDAGNKAASFANTFQNYALNLEELLLQDDDFDSALLKSDAEKIFFKYLYKAGAIKFKPADSNETTTGGRHTERAEASQTGADYSQVIKFLGTIDANNDIHFKGQTYHEIFINVPSGVGYTPTILFETSDYNNSGNKIYASSDINGRSGQTHPDPRMHLETLIDVAEDPNNNTPGYYDINTSSTISMGIDWSIGNYHQIVNDSKIDTLQDFAEKGGDFSFNAVLIYYDIFSQSNPANTARNLYGILILDNPQSVSGPSGDYTIPRLQKYKPNEITGLNGNAFGLKVNLKFNSSLDNVGTEINVNDFTTFSMDIFMDTTSSLVNATSLLLNANKRYGDLENRLESIENLFGSLTSAGELETRITDLENTFETSNVNLADTTSLLTLISNANARISSIIDGTIPTEVQYNTDVLFGGSGIVVDKTIPNKIKLKNDMKTYTFNKPFNWNESTLTVATEISDTSQYDPQFATSFGIWTRLQEFTNQLRLVGKTTATAADNNINIYIDDKLISWKDGQSFKVVFEDIDLNGNNINIYTNFQGGFDIQIDSLSSTELSNNPYFEIVCTNAANYEFEVDIIR